MRTDRPDSRDPDDLPPPLPLRGHAEDDLRFIRTAIERAGAFTSISGWGQVAVGVTALAAAAIAPRDCTSDRWVAIWLGEALVAAAISIWSAAIKAQRLGVPLFGAPAQRFTLAFATPAAAGAVLTAALVHAQAFPLLAGTWLLLYGAAGAGGGAFSVRIVPAMGAVFMAFGAAAALTPARFANLWLALGFGFVHVGFGAWIARRHGG
jgi:hypothetical protein